MSYGVRGYNNYNYGPNSGPQIHDSQISVRRSSLNTVAALKDEVMESKPAPTRRPQRRSSTSKVQKADMMTRDWNKPSNNAPSFGYKKKFDLGEKPFSNSGKLRRDSRVTTQNNASPVLKDVEKIGKSSVSFNETDVDRKNRKNGESLNQTNRDRKNGVSFNQTNLDRKNGVSFNQTHLDNKSDSRVTTQSNASPVFKDVEKIGKNSVSFNETGVGRKNRKNGESSNQTNLDRKKGVSFNQTHLDNKSRNVVRSTSAPELAYPHIDSELLDSMKEKALYKSEQGNWDESLAIFKSMRGMLKESLGDDHPKIAEILYHMGEACINLNLLEYALAYLEEGVEILYPRRKTEENLYLASLFFQIGIIHEIKGDIESSIQHVDLAKQVEIRINGSATKMTINKLRNLQGPRKNSLRRFFKRNTY